jgi:hypothetical protein
MEIFGITHTYLLHILFAAFMPKSEYKDIRINSMHQNEKHLKFAQEKLLFHFSA